jgi:hypothetical protein
MRLQCKFLYTRLNVETSLESQLDETTKAIENYTLKTSFVIYILRVDCAMPSFLKLSN